MQNGTVIGTNVPQPDKLKEVSQQMSNIKTELDRAEELYDRVKMRLSCVLHSEPESDLKQGAPPEEELTPLASEIREGVQKLQRISGGYGNMLERLEL